MRLLDAELLTKNAVLRETFFNNRPHSLFGPFVGFRHRRAVGLVINMNAGEKFFSDYSKSRVNEFMKKWNELFFFLRRCRHRIGLPHSNAPMIVY